MQCRIDAEFKEVVSLFSNVKSRLLFPFQNESVRLDHHVKKCGYRKTVFSKQVCNVVCRIYYRPDLQVHLGQQRRPVGVSGYRQRFAVELNRCKRIKHECCLNLQLLKLHTSPVICNSQCRNLTCVLTAEKF